MPSHTPPSPTFFPLLCEFSKGKAFNLKLKTAIKFDCFFFFFIFIFFTVMVGVDSQYGFFSTHFPSMRDRSILVQSEWSLSPFSYPYVCHYLITLSSPFFVVYLTPPLLLSLSLCPSLGRRGPSMMSEMLFWNFLSEKTVF